MSDPDYKPSDFIPQPCRENWHAMTGDEKKRHCEKCNTHVHDLTGMDAEEILALREKNGGRLCGAFRIGRPIALGSGIASLALASCSDKGGGLGGEVVAGGICPPPKEEPAGGKKSAKPAEDAPPKPVAPPEKADAEVPRMMAGVICPPKNPNPRGDAGPF